MSPSKLEKLFPFCNLQLSHTVKLDLKMLLVIVGKRIRGESGTSSVFLKDRKCV